MYDLRYFNFVAKPDPACYQHILDDLGVAGVEAVLLEDTPHNLGPAKALGMTTMLICDAATSCADADHVVEDIHAALNIAEKLIKPVVTMLPTRSARVNQPRRRSA
jgi:putative hydrolase of the HAD superfamily